MKAVNLTSNIAVLVSSCDEYADVWDPFFWLFWKYWADCPYPVYLNSVTKPYTSSKVRQILVGSRLGWGDGLLKTLQIIKETTSSKYLILLLDDYLVDRPVDSEMMDKGVNALDSLNGNYLRLFPKPPPDIVIPQYDFIGKISKGAPYRLSLQASLWRLDILMALLRPGDTPWDMELFGSERSNRYDGFYSTYQPFIRYINGVERGAWTSEAVELMNDEGIEIDFSSRGVLTEYTKTVETPLSMLVKQLIPLRARLFLRTLFAKVSGGHVK